MCGGMAGTRAYIMYAGSPTACNLSAHLLQWTPLTMMLGIHAANGNKATHTRSVRKNVIKQLSLQYSHAAMPALPVNLAQDCTLAVSVQGVSCWGYVPTPTHVSGEASPATMGTMP
jgi:hypothetical protein